MEINNKNKIDKINNINLYIIYIYILYINKLQIMSEKYDQIIDLVDKYYYFIVSPKKVILLSSSDDLREVKKLALKKLEPKIDEFIGNELIFVKISNTYDLFKDKEINNLGLVGGPIAFEFMSGFIENKKKLQMKKKWEIINIIYLKHI